MDSKEKNYPCTFKSTLFISSHNYKEQRKNTHCDKIVASIEAWDWISSHVLLVYLFCYLPSLLHFQASDNLRCDRTFRCSETLAVKCQGTFPKCIRTTCCKTIIQTPKCTIMQQVSLSIKRLSEDVLFVCYFKHVIVWIFIYAAEVWCSFPVSWF